MEYFEEFKRNIMNIFNNGKEDTAEEILRTVQSMLRDVEQIYNDMGCNNSTIQEYIDSQVKELKVQLNNILNNKVQNEQIEQVQTILSRMEKDIENEEENQGRNKEEIFEINSDNNRMTQEIMQSINDVIRDIQSRQNRILDANGFSYQRIEDIEQEVLWMVKRSEDGKQDEIYDILKNDDKKLQEIILQKYDEYINDLKIQEKRQEHKDSFKDEIKVDISLEQQNSDAIEFLKQENNKDKEDHSMDLPGDIIL